MLSSPFAGSKFFGPQYCGPKFGEAQIRTLLPQAPLAGRPEGRDMYALEDPVRPLAPLREIVRALPNSVVFEFIAKGAEYKDAETGESETAPVDYMQTTIHDKTGPRGQLLWSNLRSFGDLCQTSEKPGEITPRFLDRAWTEELAGAIRMVQQLLAQGKKIQGINE